MPRTQAFPYLRPVEDPLAACGGWMLHDADAEAVALPGHIEDWDYQVDIRLSRDVEVNRGGIIHDCGLDPDSKLTLKVSVHSPSADLRKRQVSHVLVEEVIGPEESTQIPLAVSIPGSTIFTAFELVTEIMLSRDQEPETCIVASAAGTRLWKESTRVRVEGSMGRFPVQEADLAKRGYKGCGWQLVWNAGDWDTDYFQGLLLLLNTGNPVVKKTIKDKDPMFEAMMRYDVARQLIVSGLRSEDFMSRHEGFDEDSVGHFILTLIHRCFPDSDIDHIATRFEASPGDFEASLQHALAMMGEQ